MFFAAATAVTSASPSPSATPVVQVVEKIKEVPVSPEWLGPLLVVAGLLVAGWLGSWLQSLLNSHKEVGEKLNVALTGLYTFVVPSAVVLYQAVQAGQINFATLETAVQTAAVVLLAAWVRHNGSKLTKPSFAPLAGDDPDTAVA
jgi:hypothetical protein